MVILASASPRRKSLLHRCGLVFSIAVSGVCEQKYAGDIRSLPVINAGLKADDVASRYPEAVVIGADTVIIHQGGVIGKPADEEDARRILRRLSGSAHEVITGVAIRCAAHLYRDDFKAVTRVFFKPYDDETIELYMRQVNVLDKAGAYGIQEHGDLLMEHVDGDMDNVTGLPCGPLLEHLRRCPFARSDIHE